MRDKNKIIKLISDNKLNKAKELCERKLRKDELNGEYNHFLAVVFFKLKRLDDAKEKIELALKNNINNPSVFNTAAQIFSSDNPVKAIKYQELAVEVNSSSTHLTNLANLQLKNGKFKEAVSNARQATLSASPIPEAVSILAQSLLSLGRFNEVVEVIEKYSKKSLHDFILRIKALVYLNRYELALFGLNQIVSSKLSDSEFLQVINLMGSLGEFDTRKELLSEYTTSNKYFKILFAIKREENLLSISDAEKYVIKTNSMSEKSNLAFNIAKYYKKNDKLQWFKWLNIANDNKKQLVEYDEVKTLKCFNYAEKALSRVELPCSNSKTDVPIFIFGMPRSGTTLVESIISAHSNCFPTGESYGLQQVLNGDYIDDYSEYSRLFECFSHIEDFSVDKLDHIAALYLKWQRQYCKTSKRLVDKMPYNFIYAALLPKLFPNAKFVYITRNPVANILSIYEQNWGEMFGFASDLKTLENYYKGYSKYMERALSTEHSNDIYHLSYESLIESPESETRNLLKYCNLDFEEACLNFNEQKRAVTTASKEQVRNRIYSSSLKPWEGVETELDDLIKAFT